MPCSCVMGKYKQPTRFLRCQLEVPKTGAFGQSNWCLEQQQEHKNEASHWQAGAITIIGDSRAKKSVGPTNRASGQNTLEHMERHLRGPVA